MHLWKAAYRNVTSPNSEKLQRRVGGTKICAQCSKFEVTCWPYVHLLLTGGLPQKLKKTTFELYPNFAALEESAKAGCDICLIWRKALLNECYSEAAQQALLCPKISVKLEPPMEIRSSAGLDIRLVSPLHAIVKNNHAMVRDRDLEGHIVKDDISAVELARQTGQAVRAVVGQTRLEIHPCAMIESDPLHDVLWRRVSGWMDHCILTHASCGGRDRKRDMPRRLVRVEKGATNVCVVDVKVMTDAPSYVALSYCWGTDQELKLDQEHESELRMSVARTRFPPTLKDVFTVCDLLQTPYVWVDALCIRQNDAGHDFEEESRRMNKIYGSAKLTLVVCSAQSVMEGFMHPRASESLEIVPHRVRFLDGRLILQRKSLAEVRAKSPLAERGWCLQEEVLSRRLLYCTDHGIFWSCSQIEFAEHGNHLNLANEGFEIDPSMTILDPHSFTDRTDPLFVWDDMINQYSSRDLKLPQDSLPAVRGLSALIHQRTGVRYLYGLWASRLPSQLLWTAVSRGSTKSDISPSKRVSARHAVPSWSWASTSPRQAVRMPGASLSHSVAKFFEAIELGNTTSLSLHGRIRPLLADHVQLEIWPSGQEAGDTRVEQAFENSQSASVPDPTQVEASSREVEFELIPLEVIAQSGTQEVDEEQKRSWAMSDTGLEIFIKEFDRQAIMIRLDRPLTMPHADLVCFEINYQGFLLLAPIGNHQYQSRLRTVARGSRILRVFNDGEY